MDRKARKTDLKALLIARLHDPVQLRLILCAAVLGAWYFAAHAPLTRHMAQTMDLLKVDRTRLALATEVEALRAQAARFEGRIPPRSDPNEFFQYVLGRLRAGPLNLQSLNPEKPRDAGPFQVASVQVTAEGTYPEIVDFLRWVETDRRMLRVDNLKLDPDSRDPEHLKVQLNVVGLMGVEEPAKAKARAKAKAKARITPKPPARPAGDLAGTGPAGRGR